MLCSSVQRRFFVVFNCESREKELSTRSLLIIATRLSMISEFTITEQKHQKQRKHEKQRKQEKSYAWYWCVFFLHHKDEIYLVSIKSLNSWSSSSSKLLSQLKCVNSSMSGSCSNIATKETNEKQRDIWQRQNQQMIEWRARWETFDILLACFRFAIWMIADMRCRDISHFIIVISLFM